MFDFRGVGDVFSGGRCIRQALLGKIGVESDACAICTNCTSNSPVAAAAVSAQEHIQAEQADVAYVSDRLGSLRLVCFVCGSRDCNGTRCLAPGSCFKCHNQNGCFNKASCAASYLTLHCACVRCFLPRELKEKHHRPGCMRNDRVKRVLLYDLAKLRLSDQGKQAKKRLEICLREPPLWYKHMAANMRAACADRGAGQFGW